MMARYLRITGLVQGVGYRAGFAARAKALHLSGWVRNRTDGSVEALVEGTTPATDDIIRWARQGPVQARVDEVQISDKPDAAPCSIPFSILPTE